jgi:NAD(P)-dependent dehydrogenase (short-subunit alcohol dehydrogenase family)
MKLDGKIAIVTGGGQGIGRAIALTLAREGAAVAIADIIMDVAADAVREIETRDGRALAVHANVTKSDDVNRLVAQTLARFQKLDILVNNAGLSEPHPTIDLSEADWDRILAGNLKSTFLCSQAVGRHMIQQRSGKIVNIASIVAHSAHPTQAPYCAGKAGVISLTRLLAVEWGKYNIHVNSVSPGAVETPRMTKFRKENPNFLEGRLEATPFHRFITPEEVANVVLFLASPESDAITGADIRVDVGSSAIWTGALPELRK